jgi:galactosamine-6-phosphate isomerase
MALSIRPAESHEAMSREAAQRILAQLGAKPTLLLCTATGTTPLRTYQLMVEHYRRKPELFGSLRILKLDEWGGLEMNDPSSCEGQLQSYLVEPLGVTSARYFSFNSNPANPSAECERMSRLLKEEGPIDLCVLGLGMNGHIAMNEPAANLQPWAHVARLTESTLRHPMLTGSRTAPTYGLTLGMSEILNSREILLLVSGANKREPLKRLVKHEIATEFPASFLWLHPNCTLLCDREASAGIDL